jgi:DNA-directed RNA polymerase subunit N (RpoN/RPB10)
MCFSCGSVIKLHKMYKEMSDEEVLEKFGVHRPSSRRAVAREPETIIPGPLSQDALTYIASRGIADTTLSVLPLLRQTTYYGRQWLCWRNVAGCYELRSIGESEKWIPSGSTKTYSQVVIRPDTKKLVICEGVFSTLSYAQLHHYEPDIYITLNSVSVVPKVVKALPAWIACGVEEIILALDADGAGVKATEELYTAFHGKMTVRVHFPETTQGCDWNDLLMEMR